LDINLAGTFGRISPYSIFDKAIDSYIELWVSPFQF
jgi:hypothetical protein